MKSAPTRLLSRTVIAWALLDLAATIWSFAIATRYLNDWLLNERGEPDWTLGAAYFVASAALVCTLPYWGVLSDLRPVRVRLLGIFIAVCCVSTAMIGLVSFLPLVLLLTAVATYCFQAALSQYDPLLGHVAPPGKESVVSGIGVSVGYFGVLLAIPIFGLIIGSGSSQHAMPLAALLFGLFALPCLLVVKSPQPEGERKSIPPLRKTVGTTWHALKMAKHAPWGRFLVARFLYADAIATVISVMTLVAFRIGGLNDSEINKLLAGSIILAIIGALIAGWVARRIGPKRVLVFAVSLSIVTIILAAVAGHTWVIWVCGPLCGLVLATINTSDRALMLALIGDKPVGEAFGIYALVGKISSGIGPFIVWGGTIAALSPFMSVPDASRVALVVLATVAAAGLWILRGVPNIQRAEKF